MYEPFLSLLDIEVPVIGALNGHAVGGGFGLALVCDIRIGALEAKYGANFVALGLAPGMSISYLLPRLIGVARASSCCSPAASSTARRPNALGIVNRAVPSAQVMTEAMALARAIADNAPFAVRATKAAIRRGLGLESAPPRATKRSIKQEPDDRRCPRGHRRAAREAHARVHGALARHRRR